MWALLLFHLFYSQLFFYFFPHIGWVFFHDNNVAGTGLVFGIWVCELVKQKILMCIFKKFGINKLYYDLEEKEETKQKKQNKKNRWTKI